MNVEAKIGFASSCSIIFEGKKKEKEENSPDMKWRKKESAFTRVYL